MKFKKIAVAAAMGLGLSLSIAPAAHAANQDGTINSNEFVFYYNSYWAGSFSDFTSAKSNLAGYVFLSSGSGQGQAVKNNSASVENYRNQHARVFFNSGYAGANDLVPALTGVQLSNTYNDNASFRWI